MHQALILHPASHVRGRLFLWQPYHSDEAPWYAVSLRIDVWIRRLWEMWQFQLQRHLFAKCFFPTNACGKLSEETALNFIVKGYTCKVGSMMLSPLKSITRIFPRTPFRLAKRLYNRRLCRTGQGWALSFHASDKPKKPSKLVTLESVQMRYEPKRSPPYRLYITFEEEGQDDDFMPHTKLYDRFEDAVEPLAYLFLPHGEKDV
jgi:hypothetical protein